MSFGLEKAFQPRLSFHRPCPANCFTQIRGLIWINNHSFWTYQCLCCKTYQFELGKATQEWGGIYD